MSVIHPRILEDYLSEHRTTLKSLQLKNGAQTIQDKSAFDAVYEEHVSRSNRDDRIIYHSLQPALSKISWLVEILGVAGGGGEHQSAIWSAIFMVFEHGATTTSTLKQAKKHILDFGSLLPNSQYDDDLYTVYDRALYFLIGDLYSDILSFHVELLRTLRLPQSKPLNPLTIIGGRRQRSNLERIKDKTRFHAGHFETAAKSVYEQLPTEVPPPLPVSEFSSHTPSNNMEGLMLSDTASTTFATSRPLAQRMVDVPSKNRQFSGRGNELRKIDMLLNPMNQSSEPSIPSLSNPEPLSCIIHGIGGVGKTQTAVQYAWEHGHVYDWIFFVRTESQLDLLNSYTSIGNKVGLIDGAQDAGPRALERVQEWLETCEERWLIIFDNVDLWDNPIEADNHAVERYWDDISRHWPRESVSASSLMITTQKPADYLPWWDNHSGNSVELRPWSKEEGTRWILDHAPEKALRDDDSEQLAEAITADIGGLPLYMIQAIAYMRESQSSFKEYLDELQANTRIPGSNSRVYGQSREDRSVNSAFDAALRRLDDKAKKLLEILSCLNPEAAPEDMLFAEQPPQELKFLQKQNKTQLIQQLRDGQLVERIVVNDEVCLATHRSVQLAVQQKLSDDRDARQTAFNNASLLLRVVLPPPSVLQQPDAMVWTRIEKYIPHIQSLAASYDRASNAVEGTPDLAKLFAQYGVEYYDKSLIALGEALMKSAMSILGNASNPAAMELRADIHIFLGIYTDTLGITRRDDGLKQRHAALKLRQQLLESKDADQEVTVQEEILLHNAYMDLSCSYQQFNRFDRVEQLSNICFQAYQSWGDASQYPFEYAKYYHSMSFLFVFRRETALAVEYAKAAAKLMDKASPGTLLATIYAFDHAVCLFQHGKHEDAIRSHEEVADLRIKLSGERGSLTLQSYLMLGIMNYKIGNYADAEIYIRHVLVNQRKAFWPEENLARTKYYMGKILSRTNQSQDSDPPRVSFTSAYANKEGRRELEQKTKLQVADLLLEEAQSILEKLLPESQRHELLGEQTNPEENEALLYDYLAPWGYRLTVPKVPDYRRRLATVSSILEV